MNAAILYIFFFGAGGVPFRTGTLTGGFPPGTAFKGGSPPGGPLKGG